MRKNLGPKTCLYPMPVLLIGSYNSDGTPNLMNAAWSGIADANQIFISIDTSHKTAKNILERKAFTISFATEDYVKEADFVGVVSGNDHPDKISKTKFHALKSEYVDAPYFAELKMTLDCKLISLDMDKGFLLGEIVNVSVDESILDENNKVSPALLKPICYDAMNHHYLSLGKVVGHAFKDGLDLK